MTTTELTEGQAILIAELHKVSAQIANEQKLTLPQLITVFELVLNALKEADKPKSPIITGV